MSTNLIDFYRIKIITFLQDFFNSNIIIIIKYQSRPNFIILYYFDYHLATLSESRQFPTVTHP